MERLVIKSNKKNSDTITRTIRMNGETFDKINAIAEKHDISFNSVVNQMLEYGLRNIDE